MSTKSPLPFAAEALALLRRRHFVGLCGVTTALCVAGCSARDSNVDASTDELTASHADRTMRALVNVILPAESGSPGAVDTGALESMRLRGYLSIAIAMGLIAKPPEFVDDGLTNIESVLKQVVVADLDAAVRWKLGLPGAGKTFVDLPFSQQTAILATQFRSSSIKLVYLLIRASCMIAFLGAALNDRGLPVVGMPPYEDFADNLHSRGFSDYSYNAIPSVSGRTVVELTVNGDIP